jgi:Tol biopolymer transport system component/DNA-binding winged helix-turn-helix (wHTH) protein
MATLPPIPPGICFGPFELDLAAGELRKGGILVKLQPQPFQVLRLLAERAGSVVTREEIQRCLWSESTFVDFEHGINFSINQIRGALADNPEKPRYIETLPRRGYRFIAAVRPASNGEKAAEIAAGIPERAIAHTEIESFPVARHPSGNKRKLRWITVAAAGIFCMMASMLLYQRLYGRSIRTGQIEQLTRAGRMDGFQPLTTDGSRIFFLEREGDHWNNMQVAGAGGESSPFPLPFHNTVILDISPDQSELLIAPFISRTGNLPLWALPLVGGAPRRIGSLSAGHATYSPDGQRLALSKDDGIYLADRDGSNAHRIVAYTEGCGRVAWSPDGKLLRFTEWNQTTERGSIWEVPAQGGKMRPLFPSWKGSLGEYDGRWTADGTYYIFLAIQDGESGRSDLWALREPPRFFPWLYSNPIQLTSGPINYGDPMPSRDPRILYAWGYALGGGAGVLNSVMIDRSSRLAKPFLPELDARDLVFSPDGESVLFNTGNSLWRSRPNGSERYQLVKNLVSTPVRFPRWSPDTKKILFQGRMEGIYVFSAEGGTPESLLAPEQQAYSADWGPDGQRIVYSTLEQKADHSGSQIALYFYDLGGKQSIRIPDSEGLAEVRWSRDGRFLAAITEGSSVLKLYDLKKKQWTEIARGKLMAMPVWAADSKHVYSQDILEPGEPIYGFLAEHPAKEKFYSFEDLLQTDVLRCGFDGFGPDGSLLVKLSRGGSNVYRIQLEIP